MVRHCLGAAGLALMLSGQAAATPSPAATPIVPALSPTSADVIADAGADVGADVGSDVGRLAKWVIDSGDNAGLGFLVVDKRLARVFAFAGDGRPLGTAPALLGAARGDINPPGIGDRPLSAIGPEDRITAAGRYVAQLGNDLGKADILWVDHAAGLSLHRVIAGRPADRRLRRLLSPGVEDNRISYGCINVSAAFFETIVTPLFAATSGIVYILPEQRALGDVFPMTGDK